MAQIALSRDDFPLTSLQPDPRNPQLRDRNQIRQLTRSVETFEFIASILVDSQLGVIASHLREATGQNFEQREKEIPDGCE